MSLTQATSPETTEQKKKPFGLPEQPALLTQPLGLEGWAAYEPVLVAALATEEPMLLIGPHGSAKSFLLERLAQVMELEYRFYNASLINYDDLVGIPLPDETRTQLRYISTPSAIWDAEIVFVDELNRTRPDLQNKLFPIIHERRVQGIPLEKLRYRWAAMNPPPTVDDYDEHADMYFGAEPLDPALADRFSFIIEVPTWQQLSIVEQHTILRDQFSGEHPFPLPPTELISKATSYYQRLQNNPPTAIEDYLIYLLTLLAKQHIVCSARRATILHRNLLAVHAARVTLYAQAYPELPWQVIDWETSALIALRHSLPQVAQGRKPDSVMLLAAHRQAWEVTRIDEDNPWRELLAINDPIDRCMAAIQMGSRINDDDLSQIILDGLSSPSTTENHLLYALVIYLAVHQTRDLRAIVYETMADDLRTIFKPCDGKDTSKDLKKRERTRKAIDLADSLCQQQENPIRNAYAANLLLAIAGQKDGYENQTPIQVKNSFFSLWEQYVIKSTSTGA